MAEITIHFDGACEPKNPGGVATCGWTIHEGGRLVASGCREVRRGPTATNNFAEYCALGLALKHLVENPVPNLARLRCLGDSMLVVQQINDEWRCNKPHLQKLRDRCLELLEQVAAGRWVLAWVPRDQNEEADALSRQAYEQATGKRFPERQRVKR